MFKRGMSVILAAVLVFGGVCTQPALAEENEAEKYGAGVLKTKVTEYTYYIYQVGMSCETTLAETKECTVAVFDRWDFDVIETTDIP